MAEGPAPHRLRLFLAFDVAAHPAWHMTVAFLGAREPAHGERIVRAVDDLAPLPPAGLLEPRRWLELPRRHPRVLAVEFADPTGRCAALQAAVAGALVGEGLFEPEHRRWLPHVSVARLRDAAAVERARPDRAAPPPAMLAFTPERLTLYRSHLGGGRPATYEALHSWPLTR